MRGVAFGYDYNWTSMFGSTFTNRRFVLYWNKLSSCLRRVKCSLSSQALLTYNKKEVLLSVSQYSCQLFVRCDNVILGTLIVPKGYLKFQQNKAIKIVI